MRDVIIVGGGPAGLSAALILGRCRRKVVVYDDDAPRNARSRGVHGFLGHDGIAPAAFRAVGRRELARYDVELRAGRVENAAAVENGFRITDGAGHEETARKLLLATGIQDRLPDVPGAPELYGRGIYPCVYCDGWELRDRPLGAFGNGSTCAEFALGLTTWSRDVVLFTNGRPDLKPEERERLARHGVVIEGRRVEAFEGNEEGLESVLLEGGDRVRRDGIFLRLGTRIRSPLAEMLGLPVEEDGLVETFEKQRTEVPGLYLSGDASHDVKFAIVAAAHGARAAHDINQALREEDTR